MSRQIKNIVMIIIILIVCVLSCFTMNVAVKSDIPKEEFEKEMLGKVPNFNNGDFSGNGTPQMPLGNVINENMPNIEGLPEKFANGQLPDKFEMPEDFDASEAPNIDGLPENFRENFMDRNFSKGEFKPNISVIYYILFFVEGLIISLLLTYLVMSKFNSKTLKETLGTSKKILIFAIIVLTITIGLTICQTILAENLFAPNNMPQFENMQMPKNNEINSNNIGEILDKDESNKI